jgi:hypothetical protein
VEAVVSGKRGGMMNEDYYFIFVNKNMWKLYDAMTCKLSSDGV